MTDLLERHYRILGLTRNASTAEIKKSYRKLALRYHPDKNPGNESRASKIFIAVNRAYKALMENADAEPELENINDAKEYFKRHFYDLVRRIESNEYLSGDIHQEECDFFFRYQIEEVHCVKRSKLEARRIIDLLQRAVIKGYDTSQLVEDHSDFFDKYVEDSKNENQKNEDIIAEYKRIIEKEPSNTEAHCNLGILYEKQGIIDSAIFQYRIALKIDPENIRAKKALERLTNQKHSYF